MKTEAEVSLSSPDVSPGAPDSDLCRSVDDGGFHILQLVSACFQFTQSQPLRSNAAIWPLKTCVLQTFNTFYFVKQLIDL